MRSKNSKKNPSRSSSHSKKPQGRFQRDSGPKPKFEFRDRTGKVHGRGPRPDPGIEVRETVTEPNGSSSEFKRKFIAPAQPGWKQDRPGKRERRDDRERGGFKKKHRREEERAPRPSKAQRKFESRGRGEEVRLKATVDKNHKGFGFLIFDDRSYEDGFVPPREAEALFHGDRVEVTLSSRGEVVAIAVLEHRFRELVGRFTGHPAGPQKGGWVVYERKKAREEIYIPQADPRAKNGDWVKAKLEFHEDGPFTVTAEITEVYGKDLPPSADIGMVAAEYNLIEEHSEAAKNEARQKKIEVPGKDLDGREDLREVPFITIDGETARDFDDAVYVERLKSGFVLWVGIADVSHYVTHGSALDQEARSRGTSVYFPERAFHMLPRELSENLCSLRPNEPRLSMVARMEYDRQGNRIQTELYDAVIESKRRATYNQIQAEWDANRDNREWEYMPHFELYQQIRKQRSDRGSIDFDLPEAELKVEPTGEVISIKQRPRLEAHRLIEEFMIAANEAVTEWMLERGWPFVYRVHEEPAEQSLIKFQTLASNVGVHFRIDKMEGGTESAKLMADVVRRLDGHPAQHLLNMALLRSMKQAVYSSVHDIHYGLASEGYTHFTSPIRRYPDLVVHRLLRWALHVEQKKLPALHGKERDQLEKDLVDITEHCSYRERLASDAERESIKLKQVRAMIPHVGGEFDGEIIGMLDQGFFVKVGDPYSEGFVSKDTLMDDLYEFDDERMIFLGRRKKRVFRIGDKVKIRVLRADIDSRKIDFGLLEGSATSSAEPWTGKSSAEPEKPGKFRRGGKKRRIDR